MRGYRTEIDGLRAIAVLPVILFHAGFTHFGGGYVGVDVFFVISGFLITTIIINDIDNNAFSFVDFYERRIRRIIPALFFIIICCIPFAVMLLLPSSLKEFSESIASVLLFVSNIFFWAQTDYFAESSHLKPLLHTWSLAVEEQYYLLFPPLLLLIWRRGPRVAISIMAAIAIFSLALAEWGSHSHVAGTFFLAPSRAWELLAGAICAALLHERKWPANNIAALIGAALICFSVFYYDEHTRAPSFYTLAPVLGACLILMYGREGTVLARVLSIRPLVGVGLISYSAYLWHQPLFAFARARAIEAPSAPVMLALSALSIILASLTWRFIERPFRQRNNPILARPALFKAGAAMAFGLGLVSLTGYAGGGFPARLPAAALAALEATKDTGAFRGACLEGPSFEAMRGLGDKCRLGVAAERPDFILWGDSIAASLADGVDVAARQAHQSGIYFGLHSCPPLLGAGGWGRGTEERCTAFQSGMINTIDRLGVKKLLLAAAWHALGKDYFIKSAGSNRKTGEEAFAEPLSRTLQTLKARGVDIIIVGPYPTSDISVPEAIAKSIYFGMKYDPGISKKDFLKANDVALSLFGGAAIRDNVQFIDLTDSFCDRDYCKFTQGERPIFFDSGHLTKTRSVALSEPLDQAFGLKKEAAASPR